MEDNDILPSGQLTEQELRALRKLLIEVNRSRWFWRGVLIWIKWLAWLPPAAVSAWLALQNLFSGPR